MDKDDGDDGDTGEGETDRERGVGDTWAPPPPTSDEAEADVLSVRWVRRAADGAGAGEAAREMSGLTTADGDSE